MTKLEFSRQIFEKSSTLKFNKNPSSGSRAVSCGQTEGGRIDRTKLTAAFRNVANAPKNWQAYLLAEKIVCCILCYLNGVHYDVSYIKGKITETYKIGAAVVNCFVWHFLQVIRKIKIRPCTEAYETVIIHGRKEKIISLNQFAEG